ncbi:hypothetical protein T265_15647, partial [Opisthorchis viverrini]
MCAYIPRALQKLPYTKCGPSSIPTLFFLPQIRKEWAVVYKIDLPKSSQTFDVHLTHTKSEVMLVDVQSLGTPLTIQLSYRVISSEFGWRHHNIVLRSDVGDVLVVRFHPGYPSDGLEVYAPRYDCNKLVLVLFGLIGDIGLRNEAKNHVQPSFSESSETMVGRKFMAHLS